MSRNDGPISGHKPWPAGGQPAEQADEKPAPRREVTYRCAKGHATTLVFAAEAVPPGSWDCRTCGLPAALDGAAGGPGGGAVLPGYRKPGEASTVLKNQITHWDQLRGRRSLAELEALLKERLAEVQQQRAVGVRRYLTAGAGAAS